MMRVTLMRIGVAVILLMLVVAPSVVEAMDVKLTYVKAHDLGQLSGELRAALPGLVVTDANGQKRALFSLGSKGDTITLWVPTGTDPAVVQAVIDAHVKLAPVPLETPDAMRRALGSIFAGTPAQKRARWGAVLEAYPPSAVLLTLLRDPLTADGKATITEILSRIKARIGQPNEVLTQAEYTALAALAATHNLGGIVP